MKTSLLKAVVCVTLVFASVLNANLMAQGKFVTNDVMAGEQVASKIIYRHDGKLYLHTKHDYKYDEQNRVVEKETFKWDGDKEAWMPCHKIDVTYTSDQIVMNYAKWNRKDKTYNKRQERNIYELNAVNTPIASQYYKWNDKDGVWKIVKDLKVVFSDVMYANN